MWNLYRHPFTFCLIVFLLKVSLSLSNRDEVFSIPENTKFLYLAFSAFCPRFELLLWNCSWCQYTPDFKIKTVVSSNDTGAYGYVAFSPTNKTIVVAFRGTDNFINDIIDVEFWTTVDYPSFPNVLVHSGFHQGYLSVQSQVRSAVLDILQNDCNTCTTILATGHSLGAALSGLCALDLALQFANNTEITVRMSNFGMPRVGNSDFAKLFKAKVKGPVWRVVHHNDIVPHLPPQLVEGYHHVSTEVWEYNLNGTLYRICDDSGEDPTCSDQLEPWQFSNADHLVYMTIHQNNCKNG
eukprot:TRINITY_DN1118_c0_g1_i1.p1 TRINITY_DN1118_c0_g1~~TRINITY_DN1118_c0_g1_i1.p1  ORF type:complete len:296 (-),score=21.78 TRINITY_DN1118_c0_g1_i1:47-934(-)